MNDNPRVSATGPGADQITLWTDRYFLKTKDVIGRFGDKTVTYAVFMRRPVIFAPRPMVDWLTRMAGERGVEFKLDLNYQEGDWAGAGEPLLYITGSFYHLVDLETLFLQKLGACCVAAFNAYTMCCDLPKAAFIAMDARHCAGTEMEEMMAYAASVGSRAARRDKSARGFIGSANDATAGFFGLEKGLGTMPHGLIGYAGSTLRAAEMFVEMFPDEDLVVLSDFFGREITDALEVWRLFAERAAAGRIAVRRDTHGGRFGEGRGPQRSYAVLEKYAPMAFSLYRNETELRYLTGTGVSAAAVYHTREALDQAGFQAVRIVCSSGFNVEKCRVMAYAEAPIDVIGTGSYLPDRWTETYATADIVTYDGVPLVKVGREFLMKKYHGITDAAD